MIGHGKVRIKENKKIAPQYYKMVLDVSSIVPPVCPGQFLHLRCNEGPSPFLRRPFSIHYFRGKKSPEAEILYKLKGTGTHLLAKKKKGQFIDYLGPLGNGFQIPRSLKKAIIVGAGTGIAPLLFLAREITKGNMEGKKALPGRDCLVLLGAKTRAHLLSKEEFKKLGCSVHLATEDGSQGFRGLISALLEKVMRGKMSFGRKQNAVTSPSTYMYACGPRGMLKEIAEIASKVKIPCQVSLEENMGCGIGACRGCAIKVKKGKSFIYKRVCTDGPVFSAEEIIW